MENEVEKKDFIIDKTRIEGYFKVVSTADYNTDDDYYKFADAFNLVSNNKESLEKFLEENRDFIKGLSFAFDYFVMY